MMVSMIVAKGNKGQIGLNNKLLWHIPGDLKNFKALTLGKVIVMGRKTFDSIGRVLPGRKTIILSRNNEAREYREKFPEVEVFKSFSEAKKWCSENSFEELVICGGGEIYSQTIKDAEKLYLTEVDYDGEADSFFPELNPEEWHLDKVENHNPINGDNGLPWKFKELKRIHNSVN